MIINASLFKAHDLMAVYDLVDISNKENKVVIKQIKGIFDKDYNETDCKLILREIKLLKRLDYPYIIKHYDIVEPKRSWQFPRCLFNSWVSWFWFKIKC